ncbi:phosphoribosylanthranilate isomerase [Thermonema lapsum]|uniref:N-(5'-phosphoribosyl)anthranilate isomerase n=1 Tax=Thermonema lapsum TaxID=28195 RepID=A0A846MMY8_9BACT|nr:phosphoribosylanthranilate isomerase [Thermonema lapsum]NIK72821.1 phosphoribosylanthranilate isomerase [Thermonema lapsum]
MMPLVKICGMRQTAQIIECERLGVPYLGFIYYPRSPRFVGEQFVMPALKRVKKVGVVVNASLEQVAYLVRRDSLSVVQLHGDESPAYCQALRQSLSVKLWKVFPVGEALPSVQSLQAYVPYVDAFLFDTAGAQRGGNGQVFSWQLLAGYSLPTPLWISGGLGLHNMSALCDFLRAHPHLPVEGLDFNSALELSPGNKDMQKVCDLLKYFELKSEQI